MMLAVNIIKSKHGTHGVKYGIISPVCRIFHITGGEKRIGSSESLQRMFKTQIRECPPIFIRQHSEFPP